MKVYAPHTQIGRTRAVDDVHHRTADIPRAGAAKVAKRLRHAARQDGKRAAAKKVFES